MNLKTKKTPVYGFTAFIEEFIHVIFDSILLAILVFFYVSGQKENQAHLAYGIKKLKYHIIDILETETSDLISTNVTEMPQLFYNQPSMLLLINGAQLIFFCIGFGYIIYLILVLTSKNGRLPTAFDNYGDALHENNAIDRITSSAEKICELVNRYSQITTAVKPNTAQQVTTIAVEPNTAQQVNIPAAEPNIDPTIWDSEVKGVMRQFFEFLFSQHLL